MTDNRDNTDELEMFREEVRKLAEKEFAPIAQKIDQDDEMPDHVIPLLSDFGLMQIQVPEAYGGPGGNLTMTCIAKEEVARKSFSVSHLVGASDFAMVLPLRHFGTEDQRQKYLPRIAQGGICSAVAMTEPHTGSDVSGIKTTARRDGDEWVIKGQKTYITKGDKAEFIMVYARTSEGKGGNGISTFVVERGAPGLTIGKSPKKMGLRGIKSVDLFFDELRVPADALVGEEGKGFKNAMTCLNYNRPTVAASALGVAQGALDMALAYAKERNQFGRPIGEFQAVAFMLADMQIQIEAARALLYKVTDMADRGDTARLAEMASIVKTFAADTAMKVTTDAVQVFGGAGYLVETGVERLMRDAKVTQIYEGTGQIQRLVISRAMMAR
ncbi:MULTISPECIES: acyl-CoA dehydrogenase family protein [Alphaproteobacteria]|uniref:Acyl-CoA dehydrogenase fadE25 n=2 Tax=Alphaproteobacteria TaxID=28211 RepID=A0ABQ6EES6_9SPHN|nr:MULTISPECIES: acyl-CoA dehydrogenase family protein [Alphaproteobacteria]GEO87066.1 putative acyl-CoA dehydrogenase fadE25 [Ciceribacter naphthalenivorans]GLR23148.1 putative acyl-CoA dehydrogenase fadE25 [Ciceribacter naphthalenivorans]GLT06004.1 putative acyl-CoA dehydrogenase fadE25 [Sphingomonas psychrolutea]